MVVKYNNWIGIGDNLFPSETLLEEYETKNGWKVLSANSHNVNFIDDEHVKIVTQAIPEITVLTVFSITYEVAKDSGEKINLSRFYQVEKIDKITNQKMVLYLKLEPYLTNCIGRNVSSTNFADNSDIASLGENTLMDYIRSPILTLQSLNYRDPLMESVIKGCNRIPIREKTSVESNTLIPFYQTSYLPDFNFDGNNTSNVNLLKDWFGASANREPNDYSLYVRLGFYVDRENDNFYPGKVASNSTKYAVFVVPAKDWVEMCEEGENNLLLFNNNGKIYYDSNSGGISWIKGSPNVTESFKYCYSLAVPIALSPLSTPITGDTLKVFFRPLGSYFIMGDGQAGNVNIGTYTPFKGEDVVISIPIFDSILRLCGNSNYVLRNDGSPTLAGNFTLMYSTSQHDEHRCLNQYSYIQEYMLGSSEIFGTKFAKSKNLLPYFKGIYYGNAYSKQKNPIIIGYPNKKQSSARGSVGIDNFFIAYVSKYSEGLEWEFDLNNFETLDSQRTNITWDINSKIYFWGNQYWESQKEDNPNPKSWNLNHIYLKQYLDFCIGDTPLNLSLILASLYGRGKSDELWKENSFINKQNIKIRTHFVNGYVHSWFYPYKTGNFPTSNLYSSRSGYGVLSALSEYQQWLNANANVLESGKTNAFYSMISGLTAGGNNILTGAMNATWAPNVGAGFTSATPNIASGLNTMLTSVTNYANTLRGLSAQKADARNSSGSQILGATTEFLPFDFLNKIGVDSSKYTVMPVGENRGNLRICVNFLQTATVNDLSNLTPILKQTLYYNGYYGLVRTRINYGGRKFDGDFGNHPYFYELADNNSVAKSIQTIMHIRRATYPYRAVKGYDGEKWMMWYINKLTNGVMFYHSLRDNTNFLQRADTEPNIPSGFNEEIKNDKPKVKTKKKTKKN